MNVFDLIKDNNLIGLEAFLTSHPHLSSTKNDSGLSPLMFAAYYRNQKAIEILQTKLNEYSVFEACAIGDLDSVKNKSIDMSSINLASHDGFSLLGLSCFFGHYEIAKYLVSKGAQVNKASENNFKVAPLHSACAIGSIEIARLLLDHGADVNKPQQSGVTPLHSAAHIGNLQLVQLLVSKGANLTLKSNDGKTALMYAQEKEAEDVVEYIEKKLKV